MIPAAREHEDDMRMPSDPYLWQSDDGRLTAFARADCPTVDDALWAWDWECGYFLRDLEQGVVRVRLGWSVEDHELDEPGWWYECGRDSGRDEPATVECWMVET